MSLLEFIGRCHAELLNAPQSRFFELRYDVMSDLFPHKPFSVEQASLDFFIVTHAYLLGLIPLPAAKSVYEQNYIDWLKAAKTVKST